MFLFADMANPAANGSAIRDVCKFVAESPASPIGKFTPGSDDLDSLFDVRAVFQQTHRDLSIEAMPPPLLPRKGRYGQIDYEKIFCSDMDSDGNIFALRGIDREQGCIVVVRPDQYVAHVLPLGARHELTAFFDGFMQPVKEMVTAERAEFSLAKTILLA